DYVKPILLSMGKDIVYCGTAGKGTAMKLCVNLLLAAMNMGLTESVKLCEKSGVSPSLFFEVIEKSPALNCGYYKIKKDKLLQKDFSPQFSLKNMLKELGFINKFSRNLNFDGLLVRELFKMYETAFKEGYYNEDLTSVSKIYDKK
ncbi:MAG: NAD-binding protein, partial [Elusimicrobiales bacterium]|nr:NAD-binding protein [Elusimicrobiales bacterium]